MRALVRRDRGVHVALAFRDRAEVVRRFRGAVVGGYRAVERRACIGVAKRAIVHEPAIEVADRHRGGIECREGIGGVTAARIPDDHGDVIIDPGRVAKALFDRRGARPGRGDVGARRGGARVPGERVGVSAAGLERATDADHEGVLELGGQVARHDLFRGRFRLVDPAQARQHLRSLDLRELCSDAPGARVYLVAIERTLWIAQVVEH